MNQQAPGSRTVERRRAAIRLIKGGSSQAEVARLLGVTREAVRRWWDRYEAGGLSGLAPRTGKRGPKPDLSEAECRALVAEAASLGEVGNLAAMHRHAGTFLRSDVSRSALRRRLVEFRLWP